MPIAAHLLGPPLMIRDGVVYAPPKGKKVWALFALPRALRSSTHRARS